MGDIQADPVRQARHDLRGRINALKLCVSAIDVVTDRGEALEFLDLIVDGADKTVVALDTLEVALDHNGHS